ncbi:MAG: Flp pilus assembly complex ATPase component TadA [Polyangiaceae bacterium]|nr:Flp pilus assembly complex ATPase component TadA [Polyangiaceae bacterium]
MAKLQQFLDLLNRPDVREVVLQSNSPPAVRTDYGLRAVAKQTLTLEGVLTIVRGTSLERMVLARDDPHQTGSFELDGRVYAARIASFGERLQIRIARSAARKRTGPDGAALGSPPSSHHRSAEQPRGLGNVGARIVLREHDPQADSARPQPLAPAMDLAPSLPATPPLPSPMPARVDSPLAESRSHTAVHNAPTVPNLPVTPAPRPLAVTPSSVPPPRDPRSASTRPPPRAGSIPRPFAVAPSRPSEPPRPSDVPPRLPDSVAPAAGDPRADDDDLPPVLTCPPPPEPRSTSSVPPAAERRDSDLPLVLGGPIPDHAGTADDGRLPGWISPRRSRTAETKVDLTATMAGIPEAFAPEAAPCAPPLAFSTRDAEGTLRDLVRGARARSATDLFIVSGRPAHVRRLGAIEPLGDALSHDSVHVLVDHLLSPGEVSTLAAVGHVEASLALGSEGRLRLNVCRQRAGLKCAIRLVATDPQTPDALGLPSELSRALGERQGLVIVASPTAQGKSTTVASLVHATNLAQPVHVVTVESRIELVHPRHRALVSQREVGIHATSAAMALRAALREDPDLIAVDELTAASAIEMALIAAQTGHLVIAAVNAPSGQRAIERLIERFPRHHHQHVRAQLAGALKLVTAQRLLPRASGGGLVPAVEIVAGGIPLWALIRDDKVYQLPALIRRGKRHGMVGLGEAIANLIESGIVAPDAAEAIGVETSALAPRTERGPLTARPSLRALLEGKR